MKYAGLIENDYSAAPGICVTFFTQGCPHKCSGCHNPETWDVNGGKDITQNTIKELAHALNANGIMRNLCIMGGEPLWEDNLNVTKLIIRVAKIANPNIKIYLWTGYCFEDLDMLNPDIEFIIKQINVLIDGPYIQEKRDITLKMRGSSNQRILYLENGEIINEE